MANPVFDPERALGLKLTKMDRQELCEFVSALCRKVVTEVGARGRRGGIYPSNISVDDNGGIAIGPAGKSPWEGEELKFIAPELYWNGQLSAASDVYSVGMLMYYAVNGGKLPLEDECRDAQLRRMGGDDYSAPKAAGRRLGEIIEKCIRFKSADRYQTLDELRAVLDSCIKNLYLSDVPSAEAIFKKNDDDLSDIERMMVGIIEKGNDDEEEAVEPAAETPVEPEPGVKVYEPSPKSDAKTKKPENKKSESKAKPADGPISSEQVEMLSKKFKNQGAPAVPKLTEEKNPELEPVVPARQPVKTPAVQYTKNAERERKIAEEVKKRRRRPLALILVLCAVLIMAAIVINAMLKDFQQARQQPDNVTPAATSIDPYANTTMPPVADDGSETSSDGLEPADAQTTPDAQATPDPQATPVPAASATPVEHSYQVFKEDISWSAARQKCEELGGHLVVINDEDELNEVISMAEQNGISRIWIGLFRQNGKESWVNGQEGYVSWAKGEPSYVDVNDQVSEDYVMLWNNNGWAYNDNRDDPCADYPDFYSGTMGYICEFGD
jgi:hypothetical protein